MAGTSRLVCNGFIESDDFRRSKAELKERTGLTDGQIDDRIEALVWALYRDPTVAEPIPGRNLWVVGTERGLPPLRLYLRPRAGVPDEAEWMWIEERP